MRLRLGQALLAMSLLVGCGEGGSELPSESLQSHRAPLTETNVDVAPECQGIITFVNTASFATLDEYLPSDLVHNLIGQRTQAPFVTLADINSVRLVGPARLEQIEIGARNEDFIDSDCAGIMDDLAISADDASKMVALVNSLSSTELHDILPYAWNGAANLLNLRPFTSAQAIANTSGIGSVSFRNLRNAATLSQPLEQLISAINALPQDNWGATMARHFDWWRLVTYEGRYQYGGLECFGIDPDSLPYGATLRQNLATAAEVRAEVANTVSYANHRGQLSSSVIAAGMANLDARIQGRSFKGCYFSYANDPWSGNNVAFFVDTVNGFSVMTKTYWVE
jgi:hypothetical protein